MRRITLKLNKYGRLSWIYMSGVYVHISFVSLSIAFGVLGVREWQWPLGKESQKIKQKIEK